ncbi:MAG TPA: DUF3788 family protein [Lacunisphaera sp.]|nr:DUF3788 family protein [Lacunisphaera sp.]
MKLKPEIDPAAAFPDSLHMPAEQELAAAVGPAYSPAHETILQLHAAHPTVTTAWQFSPRCGWYQVHLLGKRRLLYLVPKRGAFRLAMIVGRKAVARLQGGPYGRRIAKLLKSAKHYPEGIAFDFDHHSTDPGLIAALIEAKVQPNPPTS